MVRQHIDNEQIGECIFAGKRGCKALTSYYCYQGHCGFFKSKFDYCMTEEGYVKKIKGEENEQRGNG